MGPGGPSEPRQPDKPRCARAVFCCDAVRRFRMHCRTCPSRSPALGDKTSFALTHRREPGDDEPWDRLGEGACDLNGPIFQPYLSIGSRGQDCGHEKFAGCLDGVTVNERNSVVSRTVFIHGVYPRCLSTVSIYPFSCTLNSQAALRLCCSPEGFGGSTGAGGTFLRQDEGSLSEW